jgi:hypothetical protein
VNIVIYVVRHIVIKYIADVREIETSACHIRGDQDRNITVREFVNSILPRALVLIAMHRDAIVISFIEEVGKVINTSLGIQEY